MSLAFLHSFLRPSIFLLRKTQVPSKRECRTFSKTNSIVLFINVLLFFVSPKAVCVAGVFITFFFLCQSVTFATHESCIDDLPDLTRLPLPPPLSRGVEVSKVIIINKHHQPQINSCRTLAFLYFFRAVPSLYVNVTSALLRLML